MQESYLNYDYSDNLKSSSTIIITELQVYWIKFFWSHKPQFLVCERQGLKIDGDSSQLTV